MAPAFPVITAQSAGLRPTEVMVYGERNSGTNLTHMLLQRNIPAFADAPGDRIGRYGFRYGWKHGFPAMLAAPDCALAVAVFRHPETWLRSMHGRPWHAAKPLRQMEFSAFIRAEWRAIVDETNFGVTREDPRALAELQWDRHPLTGARFASILALRRAKTEGFLSLPKRFRNCLLVRHEDVSENPERFVRFVSEQYDLEARRPFVSVEERRGRLVEGRYQRTDHPALDADDQTYVWSRLDPDQEGRLGYAPLKGR